MTITQFETTRFGNGDKAKYDGEVYPIAQVDFKECLIGLLGVCEGGEDDDINWVRCENIELIAL